MWVEYAWGYSKLRFRREFDDREDKNLRTNVLKSFDTTVLDVHRCRQYARKTRDYLRVYNVMAEEMKQNAGMNQLQTLAAAAIQIQKDGEDVLENMDS